MAQGRTGYIRGILSAALVAATFAGPVQAEEGAAAAGPNTGKISFSGGVDFTNEYFFRGIYQGNVNDKGIIIQPYLDVSVELTDMFSVYFGTWNSIATDTDDASVAGAGVPGANSDDHWYEADWYAGVSIALPANFTLDVAYVVLYGPSAGDIFAEEFDITIAYDDSELWGDTLPGGLQPYFMVAIETDGASDGLSGSDQTLGDQGIYFEIGIEPSFTIVESETMPITLSIPVTIGLGEDYYEVGNNAGTALASTSADDDFFGYVDVGLVASMPITFMPSEYGAWEFSAGVHFLFLGDNAETIDEGVGGPLPSVGHNGGDDDFHLIGTVGISFTY